MGQATSSNNISYGPSRNILVVIHNQTFFPKVLKYWDTQNH